MSVRFYALVPSEDGDRVLVVEDADGNWAPPSVQPRKPQSAEVFPVVQMLRRRYGLRVPVLRCLGYEQAPDGSWIALYLTEPPRAESRLPEGARWMPAERASRLGADGGAPGALIAAWAAAREGAIPEARPPWAHRGWRTEVESWIRAALRARGLNGRISVEQRRSWSISTVLRVRTAQADLYFKALPWYFAIEPSVTMALGERHRKSIPEVVAIDAVRGWMLSRDMGGQRLHEVRRLPAWEAAVQAFAQLQLHELSHVPFWLKKGLPDRRLPTLEGQLEPALAAAVKRSGGQFTWILERIPELAARLGELRAGSVPDGLVHGDFHAGNIRRKGRRTLFFDWTDVCIAHPFLDVPTLLFEAPPHLSRPSAQRRLRRAYLEPWQAFASAAELEALLDHACVLGIIHTLVSYEQILDSMEPGSRWELEGAVPYWLERLAAQLEPRGVR